MACLRTVWCSELSPDSAVKSFPLIRLVSVATTALYSQIVDPRMQLMRDRPLYAGLFPLVLRPECLARLDMLPHKF